MDKHEEYINGLLKLIKNEHPDPLKEAIKARLRGKFGEIVKVRLRHDSEETVLNLESPPLSRDEPDGNAILYLIYQSLAEENDGNALMHLRRVIAELLMETLSSKKDEELSFIDALGCLTGFCQVRESEGLARQLRQQLWGYMSSELDKPLHEMMLLDWRGLEYARRALDLWLAVTPPMREYWGIKRNHHARNVQRLFDEGIKLFTPDGEQRFSLLLLMFRALIEVNPERAGSTGFPQMCKLVKELALEAYARRWLGLCREYGILFKYDPDWRAEFEKGLKNIEDRRFPGEANGVFRKPLQRIGLDQEIQKARQRMENPVTEKYLLSEGWLPLESSKTESSDRATVH
ncbi:MAG: hypothetical protein GY862_08850 [Gammaproteobacteria bacterium]|nr:hypothetical protein [Gammaproteobacteria bacterium]